MATRNIGKDILDVIADFEIEKGVTIRDYLNHQTERRLRKLAMMGIVVVENRVRIARNCKPIRFILSHTEYETVIYHKVLQKHRHCLRVCKYGVTFGIEKKSFCEFPLECFL
jgi:hypothetical protein